MTMKQRIVAMFRKGRCRMLWITTSENFRGLMVTTILLRRSGFIITGVLRVQNCCRKGHLHAQSFIIEDIITVSCFKI